MFFFLLYGAHRDLHVLTHSFPTDALPILRIWLTVRTRFSCMLRIALSSMPASSLPATVSMRAVRSPSATDSASDKASRRGWVIRSEEHTSELQSLMRRSYAVFCLKKKKDRE